MPVRPTAVRAIAHRLVPRSEASRKHNDLAGNRTACISLISALRRVQTAAASLWLPVINRRYGNPFRLRTDASMADSMSPRGTDGIPPTPFDLQLLQFAPTIRSHHRRSNEDLHQS